MNVGVSGHQDLGPHGKVRWIKKQLQHQLQRISFSSGISSLAAGADQLFAKTVLDLGHEIKVVIPCKGYESAFESSAAARSFQKLKKKAAECYVLDFAH